jgi:hypothetical protein
VIEFAAVYRQHVNGKVLFARPGSWACVPRGPHHHRHLLFLDKYVLGHDRTDDHVLAR